MYQNLHCLVKAFLWIILLCRSLALSNSCQVYPSEYAYLESSVTRHFERPSANCRNYPTMALGASVDAKDYIHCDGTQLRLTDSDFGSEQYDSDDYYVWDAGSSASQLLFIFPTRVNLTTITLYYYSDNLRGLPKLVFYAVPDDFDIWDAPTTSYNHVDIASMQPYNTISAGSMNVSTNVNFNKKKILMYKSSESFSFSSSEVEFFTTVSYDYPATSRSSIVTLTSQSNTPFIISNGKTQTSDSLQYQHTTGYLYTSSDKLRERSTKQQDYQQDENNSHSLVIGIVVTVLSLIAVVSISILVVLLLYCHNKRTQKKKNICNPENQDDFYSTLDRGTKQQLQTQPEGLCTELYDHIQLSPSTGQPEPTKLDNERKPYKTEQGKSESEFSTYAIVDKNNKIRPAKKVKTSENLQSSEASVKVVIPVRHENVDREKHQQNQKKENVEETYAVVQKKSKKCEKQAKEKIAPPVPLHTIESLYTAVQKKPKYK